MKYIRVTSLSVLLMISLPMISFGQRNESAIIEALNQEIIPITTFQPDSNFSDLDFLKGILKDRKVIGLGEATHGTYEFFKYKDRLIRFLVSNLGFKAIAFEADYVSLQLLDDYINGKTAAIRSAGGFPLNEETRILLAWLKDFNQNKLATDRVHIFGLEARGFQNITGLLLDSLTTLSYPDKQILSKIRSTEYNLLTKKDIVELRAVIPALYSQTAGKPTSDLHGHYVKLLEQVVDRYLESPQAQWGIRDESMLKNASWLKEKTENGKLIIWAHNGHLAKAKIYNQSPLGEKLYQKYGAEYYVIATDFNHGEVSVFDKEYQSQNIYYPQVASPKGYEYYFSKSKLSNFFINVEEASANPTLAGFLTKPHEMRSIGGTAKPFNSELSISECFDMVAFFNRTTALRK